MSRPTPQGAFPEAERPNIVYILADDLGYGDVACNDADCKIPTPNLDLLADRGMRFTDAHATSAICTPSRYSVLTGRYAWRTQLKEGIVWHWDAPLVEPQQPTVARLLRDNGYRTGCIGKWHLGWDWTTHDGTAPNDTLPFGAYCDAERAVFEAENIDYSAPVAGGPTARGFDTYFGVDVPNFPPYAWFENDTVIGAPSMPKPSDVYGHQGLAVPGWDPQTIVPECTRRAVDFIADAAPHDQPFFLYFALTSPHSPVVPNDEFVGQSGIGAYGDFVCEVDWVVGQVVDALHSAGCADNTLVIFTSDNGPEITMADDEGVYERALRTQHYSMGPLRGAKRDVWEGGHRVPFIACWPEVITPGSTSEVLVSLSDLYATCAAILGTPPPGNDHFDSESMLPVLGGETSGRDSLVLHGGDGRFALRESSWLFVDEPIETHPHGTPWWGEPAGWDEHRGYTTHGQPHELFNLSEDLGERRNVIEAHVTRAADMRARLHRLTAEGRTDGARPSSPLEE